MFVNAYTHLHRALRKTGIGQVFLNPFPRWLRIEVVSIREPMAAKTGQG
jgi:hypothetical protein